MRVHRKRIRSEMRKDQPPRRRRRVTLYVVGRRGSVLSRSSPSTIISCFSASSSTKMVKQTTLSPHDQSAVVERETLDVDGLDAVIERSRAAQRGWANTTLDDRLAVVDRFLKALEVEKPRLGRELSATMGRPVSQAGGELNGFVQRAQHMASIAKTSLADVPLTDTDTPGKLRRYIRREPLGVVGIVTAWNVSCVSRGNRAVLPELLTCSSPYTSLVPVSSSRKLTHTRAIGGKFRDRQAFATDSHSARRPREPLPHRRPAQGRLPSCAPDIRRHAPTRRAP
jgi:hypothetical protein